MAVRVEESSKKPDYLAIKFLYQGGQTEIVGVDVAQVHIICYINICQMISCPKYYWLNENNNKNNIWFCGLLITIRLDLQTGIS